MKFAKDIIRDVENRKPVNGNNFVSGEDFEKFLYEEGDGMRESDKKVLIELTKEQLIYLIEQFHNSQFLISETCVEESKWHIDSREAVCHIRDCIYDMPSLYDVNEVSAYIDMKMEKISVGEYRKRIGLDE